MAHGSLREDTSLRPSGWRKASLGLLQSESLAQEGRALDHSRSRAFVATKRVGAHIGLKAGDLLLLDTLGAFTQDQDWEAGRQPIVWASNAFLMEQTGFSLSALKRHARRLAEVGVISFKDSPNGKRWGHRDAHGHIIEAYGFDLSPLSARVEEFETLHKQLQAERAICQRLRRRITVTRRMIRARIDAALCDMLDGPWAQLTSLFEELMAKLPRRNVASDRLSAALLRFNELLEKVDETYSKARHDIGSDKDTQNTNPREVIFDPHIQITKQLNPVNSNRLETKQTTGGTPQTSTEEPVEGDKAEPRKRGVALDLPTVMQACPEFASWARNMGGYLKDWGDLHRAVGQLRPMIGISEDAWTDAQTRLGPQMATAAMVLTFDKHCEGEVASPGGYLRGMVQKAGAGELHLERSFYGRLSGRAA